MTAHEEVKKDYAYVALLDPKTTKVIKGLQSKLDKVFGNSENAHQWPPHTTISFGNLLSSKNLQEVKKDCRRIAQVQKPFNIHIEKLLTIKKSDQKNTSYTIIFKIKKNKNLDAVSEKVMKVAKKYEIPFDRFTVYRFHITLGKYSISHLRKRRLQEIIGDIKKFPPATISSFSVFYSTFNKPTPKSATDIETFNFNF